LQEVFFVSGAAASGKTKFAKTLAASRNLRILDLDDTLEKLIANNQSALSELGMERFLSTMAPERYQDLLKRALAEFNRGASLVIVAPFTKQIADENIWREMKEPFEANGVTPKLVWVNIPNTLRAARLKGRGLKRDKGKVADMDAYLANTNPQPPAFAHIDIDGAKDFPAQIKDNF
jgi:adenylate kinase family enzyme